MSTLRIALCQTQAKIGNFSDNISQIVEAYTDACRMQASVAVFSECSVSAYYARDIFLKSSFVEACENALEVLKAHTVGKDTVLIVGAPSYNPVAKKPFNSAIVMQDGAIIARRHKYSLADEGICEDSRLFSPAPTLQDVVTIKGVKVGIPICHDIWTPDVCGYLKERGAEIFLTLNASPFYYGKLAKRVAVAKARVYENSVPLVYVNSCTAHDGILFDGASFGINIDGTQFLQAPAFTTGVYHATLQKHRNRWNCQEKQHTLTESFEQCLWNACCFGLKNYVQQTGFKSVVVGLSGGIDSAVTCAIARDAIGAENVFAVMMPSVYTSKESLRDAKMCAQLLGVHYETIPITSAVETFDQLLSPLWKGSNKDTAQENLQARVRGNIIMALSNTFGHLALSTSNKSESAVGYATLYGDMCGGFSVIKDIYKTHIFSLAKWRNTQGMVIPNNTIKRPPTAELRHDQKDEDSLPPYGVLDPLLQAIIEDNLPIKDIIKQGFAKDTVERVVDLVHKAEYKRKQSATGIKLTPCDFASDRKYPICEQFSAYEWGTYVQAKAKEENKDMQTHKEETL